VLHNKMVCIHDIRCVILSTLFPLFMSNQACTYGKKQANNEVRK
jgi:hypothetical protein